jgi:hypothetical protein
LALIKCIEECRTLISRLLLACGEGTHGTKIVNGKETAVGEFPWMVGLVRGKIKKLILSFPISYAYYKILSAPNLYCTFSAFVQKPEAARHFVADL